MLIKAWGEVTIPLLTPDGVRPTTLKKVALILFFFISLILLARLSLLDIYFDLGKDTLYRVGPLR